MTLSNDSLGRYRASIANTQTLSAEQELALARRYLDGDRRAGDMLVRASLPFVIRVALEYRRWGVPLEDLVQQGNLGLLRAAAKFEPTRACRLITYAVYWIRAEIRDYVIRAYRLVRIGTTKGERKAIRAYRKSGNDDPEELARVSGLPLDQVLRLLPMLKLRDVSMDLSPDDTGDSHAARHDLSADTTSAEEELHHRAFQARAAREVGQALGRLPEREAFIVRERLLVDEPQTLEALGQALGISKERVRQLEDRARRRLRDELSALNHAA